LIEKGTQKNCRKKNVKGLSRGVRAFGVCQRRGGRNVLEDKRKDRLLGMHSSMFKKGEGGYSQLGRFER